MKELWELVKQTDWVDGFNIGWAGFTERLYLGKKTILCLTWTDRELL